VTSPSRCQSKFLYLSIREEPKLDSTRKKWRGEGEGMWYWARRVGVEEKKDDWRDGKTSE
jgi:hypothetical protein